jgi:hypothetical protein
MMDTQFEAERHEIDKLYNEACKRGTTYEAVVHSGFCTSMRWAFGNDEQQDDLLPNLKNPKLKIGRKVSASTA